MTTRNGSVVIDAGHGGSSRAGNSSAYGVRGATGVYEKDVMLQLAQRVAAHYGTGAALTRNADVNLPLAERAAIAQRFGSAVFISLHANSGPPGARGAETYVHERSTARSMSLADCVQRELGAYGHATAPIGREALAVLSPERLPPQTAACLLEVDYLSDPYGEQRLADPASLDRLGAAIARGIHRYMGAQPAYSQAQNLEVIVGIVEATVGVFEIVQQATALVRGGLTFSTNHTNVLHNPRRLDQRKPYQDRRATILAVDCTRGTFSDARAEFEVRWRANGNDIEDCFVEKTVDNEWSSSALNVEFLGQEASSYEQPRQMRGIGHILMQIRGTCNPAGGGDIDFNCSLLIKANGTIENVSPVTVSRGDSRDFVFASLAGGGYSITQTS